MKAPLLTAMLLAMLLCRAINGMAPQELSSLIEGSIKNNEPAWHLSAKERQPDSTIYRWKSGREIVAVEVFVTASKQAASDLLQKNVLRVPVPPKERVKGLGDEALLYQSRNAANGMVFFRKSNVFVRITGNSAPSARRFADHIASVVPDK